MASDLESEGYRRKADQLLGLAAQAANMAERGRLIDEAAAWHLKAVNAAGLGAQDNELPILDFDLSEDSVDEAPQDAI